MALAAAGGALAIAQPGNLGDEDTAAPAATTTSTTTPVDLTTTSTVAVTTTTAVSSTGGSTSSTLPGEATTTTVAGSGLNVSGPASGGSDGTANTGGESMLAPGLGLLGLGLVLRRASRLHSG